MVIAANGQAAARITVLPKMSVVQMQPVSMMANVGEVNHATAGSAVMLPLTHGRCNVASA
jgi:hypothetical protein